MLLLLNRFIISCLSHHKGHLKESHLWDTEMQNLKDVFRGSKYHAPSRTKSKGVMIRISNSLTWEMRESIFDEAELIDI